jgi:hypothetical protein
MKHWNIVKETFPIGAFLGVALVMAWTAPSVPTKLSKEHRRQRHGALTKRSSLGWLCGVKLTGLKPGVVSTRPVWVSSLGMAFPSCMEMVQWIETLFGGTCLLPCVYGSYLDRYCKRYKPVAPLLSWFEIPFYFIVHGAPKFSFLLLLRGCGDLPRFGIPFIKTYYLATSFLFY